MSGPAERLVGGRAHRKTRRPVRPRFPRDASRSGLVEARVKLRLPKSFPPWSLILTKHPGVVFEATNRFPVDANHIVAEVRIREEESRDWTAELRRVPKVVSVMRLDRIGRPDMYRMKWRSPPFYAPFLEKFDLVGAIPIILTGNSVEIRVALSRSRLQQLVRELRRRQFEPEVLVVRPLHGRVTAGGLTQKQRERFQVAVESGFFDVPRRVSLDELARKFSIGKSALSESLALARRKLLVAAGRLMLSDDAVVRRALFDSP